MSGVSILIHLGGAVALLLYATRMVRTGVERACGTLVRHRMQAALSQRFAAIFAGAGLAVLFQSATAVSLLLASLVGSQIVSGTAALIAVLGADLGSALVVRLLSLDMSAISPLTIVTGTAIFLTTRRRGWRQFGRILVGVGLLLLSLRLIGETSAPLREGTFVPVVIEALAADPVTALLVAALLAWLFHSSVAFILLVVALAGSGILNAELGIVLVLGANLGGGLVAVLLSRGMPPEAWAVPLTNLVLRGFASVAVLSVVANLPLPFDLLGSSDGARIMQAHILFNLSLAILALPFAGRTYAFVLAIILAHLPVGQTVKAVSALDKSVLDRPKLALANVTREIVGLCETIETMLCTVMELFSEPDADQIEALIALNTKISRRHHDVKLYLSRIEISQLSSPEVLRVDELLSACVRLEQVSDIMTQNLLTHIKHKEARGLSFSAQGWRELNDLHAALMANARLAFNVVVTRDSETALQAVKAKDSFRDSERRANALHFERLREGGVRSVDTSSLHLGIIRDLKQINALLAGLAYPVLEQGGLLLDSRIRPPSLCPA